MINMLHKADKDLNIYPSLDAVLEFLGGSVKYIVLINIFSCCSTADSDDESVRERTGLLSSKK